MHLERRRVACRFEELSFDIPRNRLVRSALISMAGRIGDQGVASKCRRLGDDLGKLGVVALRPSKQQVAGDPIGSHHSEDRLMVSAATLALEMQLPGEISGDTRVSRLERDEAILRKIFEKSVAGFYRHELHGSAGWRVRAQPHQKWQLEPSSSGAVALLPGMVPDIILEQGLERRIVIDTKFSTILTKGLPVGEKFRSANIYQIYAYLRSQAGRGSHYDRAEGILLYPSLDDDVDETFEIQGHRIRFVTVNLALKPPEVLGRLRFIVSERRQSRTNGSAESDAAG
jgi:5-methylcytosine-specific restriction enzyme subunit McrC